MDKTIKPLDVFKALALSVLNEVANNTFIIYFRLRIHDTVRLVKQGITNPIPEDYYDDAFTKVRIVDNFYDKI